MTPVDRAHEWSDMTFSGIETAFYYLFATPVGWTFWGVVAGLIFCAIADEADDMARERRRILLMDQNRAEPERQPSPYRSPAGYHRGVKQED